MENDKLDYYDQDQGCSHKIPSESMWYMDSEFLKCISIGLIFF